MAFKRGQKVRWKSQAGGLTTVKQGTVVEVCHGPHVEVGVGMLTKIVRETDKVTVKEARQRIRANSLPTVLAKKYRLKFNPIEGYRDERPHYLVEVERGDLKPYLYHPLTKHLEVVD